MLTGWTGRTHDKVLSQEEVKEAPDYETMGRQRIQVCRVTPEPIVDARKSTYILPAHLAHAPEDHHDSGLSREVMNEIKPQPTSNATAQVSKF